MSDPARKMRRVVQAGGPDAGAPDADAPAPPSGAKQVWAFLCPGPLCDTELIVPPEQAGQWVECPTCGCQMRAPHVVPGEDSEEEWEALQRMPDPFARRTLRAEPVSPDAVAALDALARLSQDPDVFAGPTNPRPPQPEIDFSALPGGAAAVRPARPRPVDFRIVAARLAPRGRAPKRAAPGAPRLGFPPAPPAAPPAEEIRFADEPRPAAAITPPAPSDWAPMVAMPARPEAPAPPLAQDVEPASLPAVAAFADRPATMEPRFAAAPVPAARRAAPIVFDVPDLRTPASADAPLPVPPPAYLPPQAGASDLAPTWIAAILATAGLGVVAWLAATPMLAMGGIVFLAVAAVRTLGSRKSG